MNPSHYAYYSSCFKALKKIFLSICLHKKKTWNQLYGLSQKVSPFSEFNNKFDEIIEGSSISKEEKILLFQRLNHYVRLFTKYEVDTAKN